MRVKKTIELLKEADSAYYNTGQTTMSDNEYDKLKDTLQKIDPTNPYFSNVGSTVTSKQWNKHTHNIQMGSLFKSQNIEELEKDFLQRHLDNNQAFIIMEKYDGLSLSLEYENGFLIHATTRGDGIVGEDILENVLKMRKVVPRINNFSGSLRAEIVLPVSSFNEINNELPEDEQMSNPRNAASGIARKKDGKYTDYLMIKYFDIEGIDYNKEHEKIEDISTYLNNKFTFYMCDTLSEVERIYNDYITKDRNNLDYWIDGLVIKLNDLNYAYDLGITDNRPKWQWALKFPAREYKTKLVDIEWNLSRTGRVNPVAIIEPTNIDGTVIRRASLHNYNNVKEMDIKYKDTITIKKAGDIIPQVVQKVLFECDEESSKFSIPVNCPVCNVELERGEKFLTCKNTDCPDKIFQEIYHYVRTLKIDGVGESLIRTLVDGYYLNNITDLYELEKEYSNIISEDGIGEKKLDNLLQQLEEKSKDLSLKTLFVAMGMERIGNSMMEKIIDLFDDEDNFLYHFNNQTQKLINNLYIEFTEETSELILSEFIKKHSLINSLLNQQYVILKKETKMDGSLSGMSFCITGKLNDGKRDDYVKIIEDNGGTFKKSIVKGLTCLINNDFKSQSSKNVKANKLGIKIITEAQFKDLI